MTTLPVDRVMALRLSATARGATGPLPMSGERVISADAIGLGYRVALVGHGLTRVVTLSQPAPGTPWYVNTCAVIHTPAAPSVRASRAATPAFHLVPRAGHPVDGPPIAVHACATAAQLLFPLDIGSDIKP